MLAKVLEIISDAEGKEQSTSPAPKSSSPAAGA